MISVKTDDLAGTALTSTLMKRNVFTIAKCVVLGSIRGKFPRIARRKSTLELTTANWSTATHRGSSS